MDTYVTEGAPKFTPLTLSIEVTDEAELNLLYTLFNTTYVTEFLDENGLDTYKIRKQLTSEGTKSLDYQNTHRKFVARLKDMVNEHG